MNSYIQHLRFPFSFLLLPVFILALLTYQGTNIDFLNIETLMLFIALHLFLYPSSNAFNTLQDNDTGSIGMVKKPLPVGKYLGNLSLILDVVGLLLIFLFCTISSFAFVLMYVIASRLYSWRKVRLKKHPIIGFLTVFVFQGAIIYLALIASLHANILDTYYLNMALTSSFLFGGAYPLTQIYQHQGDKEDNVYTLSMKLGINGTFLFSGFMFTIGFIGLVFCNTFEQFTTNWGYFLILLLPVLIYFIHWQILCLKNPKQVNYKNTMRAVLISASCMNLMLISLLIIKLTN